jgi:hypothetical protein
MNRLHPWWFGLASGVTFSVVYAACALAVILAPDATIAFFNAWFHGLDLALIKPPGGRPLTPGEFLGGLVSAAAVSFVIAAMLAALYNVLARRSKPG